MRRGRFLFLIWGKPAKTDNIKNKRWILLTPQMFEVYVKIELTQKVQVVTEQVCCSLQLHYTCLYTTRYSSMRTIIRQILIIIIIQFQFMLLLFILMVMILFLFFYNYYFNLQIQSEKRKMLHKFLCQQHVHPTFYNSNIIDYCVTYSYIFIYIRFYFGDSGQHLDNVVNGGAEPLGYILLHLVLRGYSTYNNAAGRTIKQTKKNPDGSFSQLCPHSIIFQRPPSKFCFNVLKLKENKRENVQK